MVQERERTLSEMKSEAKGQLAGYFLYLSELAGSHPSIWHPAFIVKTERQKLSPKQHSLPYMEVAWAVAEAAGAVVEGAAALCKGSAARESWWLQWTVSSSGNVGSGTTVCSTYKITYISPSFSVILNFITN